MNGIAFAPLHDMETRRDASEYHLPRAREWCAERHLPAPFLYDNRQPPHARTSIVLNQIARAKSKLDGIAFFGWADTKVIEAGFVLDDVDALGRTLCYALTEIGAVEFFSLYPGLDSSGLCSDAGFANALRKVMHGHGRWRGQIIVNAHGINGPVSRIFEGPPSEAGVWVNP